MIDLSKFDSFFPLSDYLNPDERYKFEATNNLAISA